MKSPINLGCALWARGTGLWYCGLSLVSAAVDLQVHVFLILRYRYVIKSTTSSLGDSSLEASCDTCRSFMAGNRIELGPLGILLLEPSVHWNEVLLQLGQSANPLPMSASLIPKSPSHSCTESCLEKSQLTYVTKPQLCVIVHVQSTKGVDSVCTEMKVISCSLSSLTSKALTRVFE